MLKRNLTGFGTLHVWTEADRPVPNHMVKHVLAPMPVKKGWWYKMQMFNPKHYSGNLLYFDLDVVIVSNIDWIVQHDPKQFWTINDFSRLQRYPGWHSINSSVMWFNVNAMSYVWSQFESRHTQEHRGDQDFLNAVVKQRQYLDEDKVLSWRWQAHNKPLSNPASILVFHGQPKPHDLLDNVVVKQHWK